MIGLAVQVWNPMTADENGRGWCKPFPLFQWMELRQRRSTIFVLRGKA